MTFMLLIPLLLATPTSWTLHRVSSIKYPPIYHNPPPPPSPLSISPLCVLLGPYHKPKPCAKRLFVRVYIVRVPTLPLVSALHPPSTFCRSAIVALSPSLYPSFPVIFILARTGSQAEPFLDHIRSFRDCLISAGTLDFYYNT